MNVSQQNLAEEHRQHFSDEFGRDDRTLIVLGRVMIGIVLCLARGGQLVGGKRIIISYFVNTASVECNMWGVVKMILLLALSGRREYKYH